MSKLHFQTPDKAGTAIVTLDIVAAEDPVNSVPLCFCGDCFLEDEPVPDQPLMPPSRMRRILNHVEPSSPNPRNLLHSVRGQLNGVTGEIPWCKEVRASDVAGRAGRSTGFRSPASNFVAASESGAESGAKAKAVETIDTEAELLDQIAMELWANPELNYAEEFAHGYITDFLENTAGAEVERGFCGMPTAFRAVHDTGVPGPTVGICCEYDALPGIGHACGHNLIAEATTAGFLGAKKALEEAGAGATGKLCIIGTPAEEGSCGKVELIKRGGFEDVDLAMMVHPGPGTTLYTAGSAMESCKIKYLGKNSHAAGAPWEGVNALNAVIQAFNNVDAMRQQMKPSWRVHGIITHGGEKPNIIPAECTAEWYIRALSVSDVKVLRDKVQGCFEGCGNPAPPPLFVLSAVLMRPTVYQDRLGTNINEGRQQLNSKKVRPFDVARAGPRSPPAASWSLSGWPIPPSTTGSTARTSTLTWSLTVRCASPSARTGRPSGSRTGRLRRRTRPSR
jgi:hypothetical protein